MSKFFISCDEATTICDKSQYGEAKISEKIKSTVHFLTCKLCKCYSQQNGVMTKIFGIYANSKDANEKHLSKEEKDKLEKAVKEKML
ncbi:MAG: hypothetical protein KAH07_07300 [Flavobacteriaceae bacterium]|nr:hypothetical protein [Flavobacteriaceae bacterium]